MKFKLEFEMDNAAFDDFPEGEVARILHDLADRVGMSGVGNFSEYRVNDINGNTVGRAVVVED